MVNYIIKGFNLEIFYSKPGDVFPEPGKRIPEMGSDVPELGKSVPESGKRIPEMGWDDPRLGMVIFVPGKTNPGFNGWAPQIAWLGFKIERFNFEIERLDFKFKG